MPHPRGPLPPEEYDLDRVLREIHEHGRPQCRRESRASAWARRVCMKGLAERTGLVDSGKGRASRVAEYELTDAGFARMDATGAA